MSQPGRGRGRRNNGLDAALWAPLRDVDPRVGEHLLDVLRDAGIPAYLEPSADVSPYTRTVHLPSPPSDRLFVDRSRRPEARALVERHCDELARRPRLRRDLDEAAEWRRIVAAFEAEHGRTVVEDDARQPACAASPGADLEPDEPAHAHPAETHPGDAHPADAQPAGEQPADEHYEPPPPPPLRAPAPASLYAVLLIAAGALLVLRPEALGLSGDRWLLLGVLGVAGGAAVLVARMREHSVDDGDDGAVV